MLRDGSAAEARFVLCRGDKTTEFRLLDDSGSAASGATIWDIRSPGRFLERVRFGTVPHGFEEVVAYRGIRGVGRVSVTDWRGAEIMSFTNGEVRDGRVLRADYELLAPSVFERQGRQNCRNRVYDDILGLGITTPLLFALFLFAQGLRRRTHSWVAHSASTWLVVVAAALLATAAVMWWRVLAVNGASGGDLPLLVAGLVFYGWVLGLAGLLVALLAGAVLERRRPATREPRPGPFPWRPAIAAFPVALALAGLVELVRPWTTTLPP